MPLSSDVLGYAISLLKDLVSIPTVNPPGMNYGEMSNYLRERLEDLGFSVKVIKVPEEYLDRNYPYSPRHRGYPRYVVIGRYGEGEPVIHFNSHYDVVPAGDGWLGNPFELRVEGSKLIGRGASDMKGGIAALLTALHVVIDEGSLKAPVEAVFVPDEESGGLGTKYLVEELHHIPKHVVITEPTSRDWLGIGHKGVVRGLIKIIGEQAHAARPWYGVNAFEKACMVVVKALPRVREALRKFKSSHPFRCEDAAYATVSLGGYVRTSAMKDNVVPGEFIFSYDLRVIPELSNEDVLKILEESITSAARSEGVEAEVIKLIDVPPAVTPPDSPLIKFILNIASEALGFKPKPFISCGRYDLVFYRLRGSHVAVYGPGVLGQAHSVNEYLTKDELKAFIKVYSSMLRRAAELVSQPPK